MGVASRSINLTRFHADMRLRTVCRCVGPNIQYSQKRDLVALSRTESRMSGAL